jgi:membrane protease YdiL (CAAX protease family)
MPWDFAILVLLLGVILPWRAAVRMRHLLSLPATTSQQRLLIYASTMLFQWLVSAAALWRAFARGFSARGLGLALDEPVSTLAVALPACALMAASQYYGLRRLARLPPDQRGFADLLARKMLPQNSREVLVFVVLAATVSICEEFLYRGILLAALERIGLATVFAVLVSTALFALGHLYQGAKGIISTFLLGLAFCVLRITMDSLVPCMAVHFAIDLVAGLAAPRILAVQVESIAAAAGSAQ